MRERGFEKVKAFEEYNFLLPARGSVHSACYDFYLPDTYRIAPDEVKLIPLGVKAYMNSDEVLLIFIRSSASKTLTLQNGTGIIDSDYYNNESNEGLIYAPLINTSRSPIILGKNERYVQGMFCKYLTTDMDNVQIKRSGGLGSTGKQ